MNEQKFNQIVIINGALFACIWIHFIAHAVDRLFFYLSFSQCFVCFFVMIWLAKIVHKHLICVPKMSL